MISLGAFPGARLLGHRRLSIGGLLSTFSGWRLAIDLIGLAFAGGLYVVPSFASVQAGAAADRRARVIAGVNVLSAAFMTVSTLALIGFAAIGFSMSAVLAITALGNLVAMALVLRAWGRQGMQDLAMLIFRSAYSLEITGLENLPPAGTPCVITPNHTSFMDGPVMHALLPKHASFAVDTGIAEAWWVAPFLKLINAHTMDPTKPFATRDLIKIVKGGETLVIFPEGRLTVTSGLMKVYEGAGLIADKSDALVVPVRIEGLERTPFSYLRVTQLAKQRYPKVRGDHFAAAQTGGRQDARQPRPAAGGGRGAERDVVEAAVQNARIDQSLFEALLVAKPSGMSARP